MELSFKVEYTAQELLSIIRQAGMIQKLDFGIPFTADDVVIELDTLHWSGKWSISINLKVPNKVKETTNLLSSLAAASDEGAPYTPKEDCPF